jgi:hypothetical protein
MYLCYVDESGTSEIPGSTSHFILAGISIPIWHWRTSDRAIYNILARYGLGGSFILLGFCENIWSNHGYQILNG